MPRLLIAALCLLLGTVACSTPAKKQRPAPPMLEFRIEADPGDHQARFDLAVALGSGPDKEKAVDHLIEIVRRDREWNEDGARLQLLQFFEAWGHKDPATGYGRRRLSSVLFR